MSETLRLLDFSSLTSYSNATGTVSASSEYSGNLAWHAFTTAFPNVYWHSNAATITSWLKVQLTKADCIQQISFRTRSDNFTSPQLPNSLNIYGSNDDVNYTLLDSRTMSLVSDTDYTFSFQNNYVYKYYRFDMTSTTKYIVVHLVKLYASNSYYVFKKDNYYISIKDNYYNTSTKTYNIINADGINPEDIVNIGFNNLASLYQSITINGETFVPIDKIKEALGNRYRLVKVNKT